MCDLGFFVKMNGSGAPYQQSDPLARFRRWLTEALRAGHFRRTIRQGAVVWHQYGRLWSFNCHNTVATQTDPTVFRPDDQVLVCLATIQVLYDLWLPTTWHIIYHKQTSHAENIDVLDTFRDTMCHTSRWSNWWITYNVYFGYKSRYSSLLAKRDLLVIIRNIHIIV